MKKSTRTAVLAAGLGLGLAANVAAQDMNTSRDVRLAKDYTKDATMQTLDNVSKFKPLTDKLKFKWVDSKNGDTLKLSTVDWLTGVEYSDEYGVIYKVWVQINPNKSQSFLLQWEWWEEHERILWWAWFKIGENGMLSFMWEHFVQQRDNKYMTSNIWGEELTEEFDAKQDKFGVNIKFKSFELWGSYSKSDDVKLQDTDLIVNTDALWQKYNVENEFVWQEATSGYVANTFDITKNSDLRLALWLTTIDGDKLADGWADFNIYMWTSGKISIDAHRRWETNKYGAGYEWNVFNTWATWTAKAEYIDWTDGYEDTRGSLMLNIPFGKSAKKDFKKSKSSGVNDVSNSLRSYVEREKSYQVLWKIEQTNKTLLAQVDKTWIPANAEVDATTWDIVVNGLNAFTTFTSITRDWVAYATSAFTIQGWTSVHIDLSDLPAVTWTTDTYVLTTDWVPANTITIVVAHWSIIVRSIDVTTAAPVETAPIMWDVPNTTIVNWAWTTLDISSYVTLTEWDAITTYTLTWALPAWITFNSANGTFSWTTTATGSYPLSVTATDNDWESNSDSFTITVNAAPDTTPNAFTFVDQTDVATTASLTSNVFTVLGTDAGVPVPISISTPDWVLVEYAINWWTRTSNPWTTELGQQIGVRIVLLWAANSTTYNAILNIWGVTDTFSVTTEAANTAPTLNLTVTSPDGTLKWDVYSLWVDYTLNDTNTFRLDASTSSDPEWTVDNFRVVSDLRWEMHNSSTLSYDVAWWTEFTTETFTLTITDNWWLTSVQTVSLFWE